MKWFLVFALSVCVAMAPVSAAGDTSLQGKLRAILQTYLNERGKAEHIDAASVTVSLRRGDPLVSAAVGATPATLFQIGSNTKAFTAIVALQLEAAGKLNIDQPIGKWLPQYPAWKNLTIRRMLNMTSGLPTYDYDPKMLAAYGAHPHTDFTAAQLVGYVYPKDGLKGWHYSNTGYILTQMIVERITGKSFADVLRSRVIEPAGLRDTFYYPNVLPASLQRRLAPGYFASNDPGDAGLEPLYGKDVSRCTMSWAQAAGGIVSTAADLTRWARVLYEKNPLPPKQRAELFSMVSSSTGRPITVTTKEDPRGFGLGVTQMLNPVTGRIWFYEGMTLGYRAVHAWLPQSDTVISVFLNSQPNPKQNHIGELVNRIVAALPIKTASR